MKTEQENQEHQPNKNQGSSSSPGTDHENDSNKNKVLLKFKIPKIDSVGGSSSSSSSAEKSKIMINDKSLRVCGECNKEFGSRNALSGHMRIHGQAFKKERHLHEIISTSNRPMMLENHHPRSDSDNSMSDDPLSVGCSLCDKKFPSMRSLFGHMRCHPERDWRGIRPPRPRGNNEDADENEDGDRMVFDCSQQLMPKWTVKARRGRKGVEKELDLDEDEDDDGDGVELRLRNVFNHLLLLNHVLDSSHSSGLSALSAAAAALASAAQRDGNGVDQHPDEEVDHMRFVGNGFEQVGKEGMGSLGKVDDYPVTSNMMIEQGGSTDDQVMKDYIGSVGQEGNAANYVVENHDAEDESDGMNTELVLGNIGGHKRSYGISNKDKHGEMAMGNSKNKKAKKMKMTMESNQEKPAAVGGSVQAAAASIATEKYKCSTCNKSFSSHQALGGHRSSHNKFKLTVINGESTTNRHPPHQPLSVSAFDQNQVNNEEFDQRHQQQLNTSHDQVNRVIIDEVGGSSKADHISSAVHQCSVCNKTFPTGQALGGHKRSHWTAPADGQTEVQALPQAQLAVRSSGEAASTQVGCKRIRLMGFDLDVPASMVDDAQDGGAGGQ